MVDCDRNEIMRCHIYLLTLKCETCFRCLSQMTWTMILMSCCKSLNRVVSGQFYTHYSSTSCSADVFDFVASVVAMLLYSSSLMLCSCMPTRLVPHGTASKLLFLFHLFILCTWICVKKQRWSQWRGFWEFCGMCIDTVALALYSQAGYRGLFSVYVCVWTSI